MYRIERVKLTAQQTALISHLIKEADFGPSQECSRWFRDNFPHPVDSEKYVTVFRCKQCKGVAYGYPMILHLIKQHKMSLSKALTQLHIDKFD